MSRSPLQVLAIATLLFVGYTPNAHAYLDPTAAGAALQSLYLMLISCFMFIAVLPHKVAAFFAQVKHKLSGGKATPSVAPVVATEAKPEE